MRPWSFPVAVDPKGDMPLFLQIARAIAGDVLRGRLRPGDALPGSRALADMLDVHRSTVVTAYGELAAQGWTVTRAGSGTVIATSSPDVKPRRFSAQVAPRRGVPAQIGFDLAAEPPGMVWPTADAKPPAGTLVLWGGIPDVRLVSLELLGRALRRATRLKGRSRRATPTTASAIPGCARPWPGCCPAPGAWPPGPRTSSSPRAARWRST